MAKRRAKNSKEASEAGRVPASIYFERDEMELIEGELNQLPVSRPRPSLSFFIRTLALEAVEARSERRELATAGK